MIPAAFILMAAMSQQPTTAATQPPPSSPPDVPVMAMTPDRRPVPTRNVKVDVTIADQTGSTTALKKVVSLLVADGRPGLVRSNSNVPLNSGPSRDLPLNVDVTAFIQPDSRILLELRFNYSSVYSLVPLGAGERPVPTTDEERVKDRDQRAPRPAFATITETLMVLLTPGQSTVVARSADAAADRTVTVEVKADIAK